MKYVLFESPIIPGSYSVARGYELDNGEEVTPLQYIELGGHHYLNTVYASYAKAIRSLSRTAGNLLFGLSDISGISEDIDDDAESADAP